MTEKRFTFTQDTLAKADVFDGDEFVCCTLSVWVEQLVDLLNQLNDENEQLKKELHLMHMRGMFSTVKSFKGNISKRYTYSEETDNVYDVANHYGQYCKILSKKEMVMLLNEYETVLKELKGDLE